MKHLTYRHRFRRARTTCQLHDTRDKPPAITNLDPAGGHRRYKIRVGTTPTRICYRRRCVQSTPYKSAAMFPLCPRACNCRIFASRICHEDYPCRRMDRFGGFFLPRSVWSSPFAQCRYIVACPWGWRASDGRTISCSHVDFENRGNIWRDVETCTRTAYCNGPSRNLCKPR